MSIIQLCKKIKSKKFNLSLCDVTLKQSSLQGFEEYLKHYDWLPVLSENNVDIKVDSFLEITHNITDF